MGGAVSRDECVEGEESVIAMGCCGTRRKRKPRGNPISSTLSQGQSCTVSDPSLKKVFQDSFGSDASRSSHAMPPLAPGTPTHNQSLRRFKYKELQQITRNFAGLNYLGEGGFGKVYKGALARQGEEPLDVAVKVLDVEGCQGVNEWLSEIMILETLKHENLVNLVGYSCDDGRPKLLVYELAHRGSLDAVLFSEGAADVLTWEQRLQIALDAAKGLEFLHSNNVIHRDFKPANILIDRDLRARVTDFGMAKAGPEGDASHVSTVVKGTLAYLDPNYGVTGHLTSGSDVYAFGITLIELISGRPSGPGGVSWATPLLAPHRPQADRIVDPRLGGNYPKAAVIMASVVAKKCIEKDPGMRPPMSHVRRHLERALQCKNP